jgi:hypothetical protein
MDDYNYKKGKLREKVINQQSKQVYGINVDDLFYSFIYKFINYYSKSYPIVNLLDIGTGTGIVPRTIQSNLKLNISIDAIDKSIELINIAKSMDQKSNYILIKNKLLANKKYQIITNRLCPRYKIDFMSNHILDTGIYIFKEYDKYRGIKEIKRLFPNRWIKRKESNNFITDLNNYNFKYISIQKYIYNRKYTIKEIDNILKSTNIIKNYSRTDYNFIKQKLGVSFYITQDPYILIASKNFNFFKHII